MHLAQLKIQDGSLKNGWISLHDMYQNEDLPLPRKNAGFKSNSKWKISTNDDIFNIISRE